MKSLKFFVLLTIFKFASCDAKIKTSSLATQAINGILEQSPMKDLWRIDVICHGQENGKSEKIIKNVLKNLKVPMVVQISTGGSDNPWRNWLNTSSILLFDSREEFNKLKNRISWQNARRTRHKHLVHIINGSTSDIENITDGFQIDNVDFLINESEGSIELVTGFMFTSKKCRSNQSVTINNFKRSTRRWASKIFYPDKYRNFHGCNLTLGYHHLENYSLPFNIYESFGNSLNFQLKLKYHANSNETLKNPEIDLFVHSPIDHDNSVATSGYPMEILELKLAVPPGELYTPLEKIFLPFDLEVWIAIVVFLLIGLATIQIINLCSIKVKNFVFGNGIRTPTVNFTEIFLSGGQFKVPRYNFARFLLTMFLIWCLIIRTCYQSEYFKNLQADKRKPQVKTFAELIERNFTFFCQNFGDHLNEISDQLMMPR